MKYQPDAIQPADLDIVSAPSWGAEWNVYVSEKPAKLLAEILMPGSNQGILTLSAVLAPTAPGVDYLQIVATERLRSAVAAQINLECIADDNQDLSALATFQAPARAANQSFNFPRGFAQDLVPATPGKKIKTLVGLNSIVGGAANCKFAIYELPERTDYTFIGCTTDIDFNMRGRTAKGIDCGMETDAFVKRGKTKPGNLSIGSKLKDFVSGLARFDGAKVTVLLENVKDGQVTGTRLVFTEWIPSVEVRLPDGDNEATADVREGKYTELLIFEAP